MKSAKYLKCIVLKSEFSQHTFNVRSSCDLLTRLLEQSAKDGMGANMKGSCNFGFNLNQVFLR